MDRTRLVPAMLAGLALTATGPAASAEATLPPPRLAYLSAFDGMPSNADPPAIDWRASNALVGALQGHAGHLRPRPPAAPALGAAAGASAAHDGHGTPRGSR